MAPSRPATESQRPTPWPSQGLESVAQCPVCDSKARNLLYSQLVDRVFRTAPGEWMLWRCAGCRSAYIDPRPTPDTIGLAYSDYYTHRKAAERDDYASLGLFRRLRRQMVNGYTNWRFSTSAEPASRLGVAIALMAPPLRTVIDRQYRNLPRPPKNGGAILDVGCGDGSFLGLAHGCGWEVFGVDFDTRAVANAASDRWTVLEGGVECFEGERDRFDVITLSHVLEHLHNPIWALRTCHELLKPGGRLWIETPNVDSLGHARFGRHWRGLEPPRHLVLFNQESLRHALLRVGFASPQMLSGPIPHDELFRSSLAMARGRSAREAEEPSLSFRLATTAASLAERLARQRREFLTVSTRKAEA